MTFSIEMQILFPCSPLRRVEVDQSFAGEFAAARQAGFQCSLYSHESLEAGNAPASTHGCTLGTDFLLRGWMMTGEQYAAFHGAMAARGSGLVTSVAAYCEAHYLPLAYGRLAGKTPRSGWISGDDIEEAWALYQEFRAEDAVIKDWVKSAKHLWRDGCFIPAQCSHERFSEIFRTFRQARAHLFNRGVVIRHFARLATRGADIRGFPVVEEYRLFYFRQRLLACPPVEGADSPLIESARWDALAREFESPFISIDVARLEDGGWTVIEVGDGGVSGLPLSIEPEAFYRVLYERTAGSPGDLPR